MAGRDDGSQRLNELLGHDFSDFLRKLHEEQLRARTRAPGVKGRTESQGRQHQPTSEGDISANNAGCGQIVPFPSSDHLPIEVTLSVDAPVAVGGARVGGETLPLLPKLKWTQGDEIHYRDKVGREIAQVQL
ncbi:hypothetical protein J6590_105475, partial [Homalodisca vitripennis]